MANDYHVALASPEDALGIASLFSVTWTSPFARLQFGSVNTTQMASQMAPRLAEWMDKPGKLINVIKEPKAGKVISCAQWTIPESRETFEDHEEMSRRTHGPSELSTAEKIEAAASLEEEYIDEAEKAYIEKLPKEFNVPLIKEFRRIMLKRREECIQGRRHYLLENLATIPEYQHKGLASSLIKWAFEKADEDGAMIYLDTEGDGAALRLYSRLGFVESGRESIDNLSLYGGEGSYTLVGMIRYPKSI